MESTIVLQAMNMIEEFLKMSNHITLAMNINTPTSLVLQKWIPSARRVLKVSTDIAISIRKMGIGILVWNHLGIPLLEKSIPLYW